MPKWALFLSILTVTSCGGFRLFTESMVDGDREIASVAMERFIVEENLTFVPEIDQKLDALFSYYALAQKNLKLFDDSIDEAELQELYQSSPYLTLLAIKTQVDEIETEIKELSVDLGRKKQKQEIQKLHLLHDRIKKYAARSSLSSLAMLNLAEAIGIKLGKASEISEEVLAQEIKNLEGDKEFRIYEKNVEHLSHLLATEMKTRGVKFRPSEAEVGTISGQEFPAKVWAITFNNGPHKAFTGEILKNLKEQNLKATFFYLSSQTDNLKTHMKDAVMAGMEMATSGASNKDLTKVGNLTLENEISEATREMEEKLKVDIKLFRLPYGAGIDVPAIRQQIAKNDLIHVHWNVDTLDWAAQSPARISERARKLMRKTGKDSGIIVFHELHQRSVTASLDVMRHLKEDGRRVCTVGAIIDDMNKGNRPVCSQNSY